MRLVHQQEAFALGTNPKKSGKIGVGQCGIPVTFGAVTFSPGAGSTTTTTAFGRMVGTTRLEPATGPWLNPRW
jgi:hypothetical protein